MVYCKQCLEKQREIDDLKEKVASLQARLRYQERTAKKDSSALDPLVEDSGQAQPAGGSPSRAAVRPAMPDMDVPGSTPRKRMVETSRRGRLSRLRRALEARGCRPAPSWTASRSAWRKCVSAPAPAVHPMPQAVTAKPPGILPRGCTPIAC